MLLSCCAWALGGADTDAIERLAEVGLTAVDVRPSMLSTAAARNRCRTLGLEVCCMAASHELPDGVSLGAADPAAVEAACAHVEAALTHAANLGAGCAYVVPDPGQDERLRERYTAPLTRIADHGRSLGIKVCVEHFPGTAFPTVAGTLAFLEGLDHPNLYLLFDIGHAQMSREAPADVLLAAAARLGYVHLDDNDGVGDLHLALTDGVMSRASLAELFTVLGRLGYDGPVSLEMKNDLPDPLDAIRRSAATVRDLTS